MSGFPWNHVDNKTLFVDDLNAAFAQAYAQAAQALLTATQAMATGNALATLTTALSPVAITLGWPAGLLVTNGTYVLAASAPYNFTATSVDSSVGSQGGALLAMFLDNGAAMGSLASLSITAQTKTNTPATGANLVVQAGTLLTVQIQIVSGAPADAYLCLNGTRLL